MFLRGPNQKPWDGKLEYDYQLWIDSDIVFDTAKFWQLCDLAFPADAVVKEEVKDEEGNVTQSSRLLLTKQRKMVLLPVGMRLKTVQPPLLLTG